MKRKPSDDDIKAMLHEGHFATRVDTLPTADPLVPTQMLLPLDRIRAYDGNPRQARNPLYQEIRASIEAQRGLNNPLTVTRRPGDEHYMVESGGNTRLEILNELWQETGEEDFSTVHCLFRPWVSESHVLTAHLIENDTRGDLIYRDRARAVRSLRDRIEQELNKQLTQREFTTELATRGYALDQSSVSRMMYTLETLEPAIPDALRAGLGARTIRSIRRLDTAALTLLKTRDEKNMGLWPELFQHCLAEHDQSDYNIEALRREIEDTLARCLDLSLQTVRLEFDALLEPAGQSPSGPMPVEPNLPQPAPITTDADRRALPDTTPGTSNSRNTPDQPPTTDADSALISNSQADHPVGVEYPSSASANTDIDIQSLRQTAFSIASRLCTDQDLEPCLHKLPHSGMGFLVDLPHESIVPVDGHDAIGQLHRQWLWWLLLSLSEAAVDPDRVATVPDGIRLKELILERRDAEALSLVGDPDWKAIGYEFLSDPRVPDDVVEGIIQLTQCCRQIRVQSNDIGGLTLWPELPHQDSAA